jgi:arginine N-succinyltransferase
MYILRSVAHHDLKDLLGLSELVVFINLPPDEQIIEKKIESSIKSFKNPDKKKFYKNYYLFVLEDLENKEVVGVSMIHAQHGTEEEPHFFLKVSQEHKFSKTLNTGFIHGTLKLGLDTNGPTEIGGLVINPECRNNPEKLGKQISFVRFLYMAMYPERFKPTILSELMPPLDKQGNSPLWEAIGRRFLNMGYQEADILSRSNKEFILSLYPSDTIYETLLPLEARNSIGKVGKETEPVKRMLESIGFKYVDEVDPFDGGPHFRTELKSIKLVQNMIKGKINTNKFVNKENSKRALFTITYDDHDFAATQSHAEVINQEIFVEQEIIQKFNIKNGAETNLIFIE